MSILTLKDLAVPPPKPSDADWNDDGVLILKRFFSDLLIDAYRAEWADAHLYDGLQTVDGLQVVRALRPRGWQQTCPYMDWPALRRLCCDPDLATVLEMLTGDEMGVYLNLTGWVTTGRDWHADTYLNEPGVGDWYAAIWVALDDIHPDSGVFQYVPGSHRWPQITRDTIGIFYDLGDPDWPRHSEALLTPLFEREIELRDAHVVSYVPKKGDVLIWHSRLLHRGSRARVPDAYRPSLIAHYSGIHHRPLMPAAIQDPAGGWYFPNENLPVYQ